MGGLACKHLEEILVVVFNAKCQIATSITT